MEAYLESSQYKMDVGREMVETVDKNGDPRDLGDENVEAWLEHGLVPVMNGRTKFKAGNRDTDDGEVEAHLESSQHKMDVGREMVETSQKDGAELDLEGPNVQAHLEDGRVMVMNGRTKFMAGNRDTKDDEVKAYLASSQYKRGVGREMVETAEEDGAELDLEDPNVKVHLEDGNGKKSKRDAAASGTFTKPTVDKAKAFLEACGKPVEHTTVAALQLAYKAHNGDLIQLSGMIRLFEVKFRNDPIWTRLLEATCSIMRKP